MKNKFRFVRIAQGSTIKYAVDQKKLFGWKQVYWSSRPEDCAIFIERCAKEIRTVLKDDIYCETIAFPLEKELYAKLCKAAVDNDKVLTPEQMALKIVAEFLINYTPRM